MIFMTSYTENKSIIAKEPPQNKKKKIALLHASSTGYENTKVLILSQ